jgi:hypothetical protein
MGSNQNNVRFDDVSSTRTSRIKRSAIAVWSYRFAFTVPCLIIFTAWHRASSPCNWNDTDFATICYSFIYAGGPLTVLLGTVSLRSIIRSRGDIIGKNYAIAGIVVGGLASVVGFGIVPYIRDFEFPGEYKAACQNNLKRLGLALQQYTEDYDGTLPSSYLCGQSPTWNKKDFERFASIRGTRPPMKNPSSQTWPMLLEPYLKYRACLWCPYDPADQNDPNARVSYYWKAAIDRAWYGGYRKLNDFAFQADQILFYERKNWHYGSCGLADGNMVHCGYLDTHVRNVCISQSGFRASEKDPGPLPKNCGEPAWFNYSMGNKKPQISKGRNWNPKIWADKMP